MLSAFISWLDAARWHFWLVGFAGTALWSWTVLRNEPDSPRGRRAAWLLWTLASIVMMMAWRWPYFVGPAILNPDEAQIIAGAITLKSYPVFWKYVDGTTHGPLTDLPLLVANLFGVPLNYAGARFVGGAMLVLAFAGAARGLSWIYPPRAVRLGLSALLFFWATVSYYDFTGYTSEQASIALLLIAVWPLLAGLLGADYPLRRRLVLLGLGGFLLGCVPYAKLQGVPSGMALGFLALVAALRAPRLPQRHRRQLALACFAGALLPSALLGLYLWIYGLRGHFWASYVLNNLLYASADGLSWGQVLQLLWAFMDAAPGFQWVVVMFGAFAAAAVVASVRRAPAPRRWPWLAAVRPRLWEYFIRRWQWQPWSSQSGSILGALGLVLLASLYAAVGRHQLYGHYLQYVMLPVALGSIVFCGELWRHLARHPRWLSTVPALVLALVIFPLASIRSKRADPEMLGWWTAHGGEWRSRTSLAIARLARPGDTMAVWGWMPYFHVETQLPQATREAHTYRQIEPSLMRHYYRLRYLGDLRRSRPRIFVDAVGGHNFSYGEDRKACAHESFPELRELIDRDYVLVETVDSCRIYLRKPQAPPAS